MLIYINMFIISKIHLLIKVLNSSKVVIIYSNGSSLIKFRGNVIRYYIIMFLFKILIFLWDL